MAEEPESARQMIAALNSLDALVAEACARELETARRCNLSDAEVLAMFEAGRRIHDRVSRFLAELVAVRLERKDT
jgi:hypothetical protein